MEVEIVRGLSAQDLRSSERLNHKVKVSYLVINHHSDEHIVIDDGSFNIVALEGSIVCGVDDLLVFVEDFSGHECFDGAIGG